MNIHLLECVPFILGHLMPFDHLSLLHLATFFWTFYITSIVGWKLILPSHRSCLTLSFFS